MKILQAIRSSFPQIIIISCFLIVFTIFTKVETYGQINSSGLIGTDTTSLIEEKLVQLALQGPQMKNTEHLSKISEYQLKAAQNTWMNLLAFNVNYNEFTFERSIAPQTYVYPRYNLGITVPLGTILSRTAVKSAKENVEIGKNNAELLKRDLREQVLTAYKEYIAYSQLIEIQSESVNDAKTQLAQAEEKFRNGSISIDAYSNAQKNNNAQLAALVNLKLQQDLKKLEIEKLIGVKLETVLKK